MFRRQLLGLLVVCTVAFLSPKVQADINTDPGVDFYRLAFVTSVGDIDASRNDIDYYNGIVQNLADAVPELAALRGPDGQPLTWKAIVSTDDDSNNPEVNARTNTEIAGWGDVPIYSLDTKSNSLIASNFEDLWDGSIQNGIFTTELGGTYTGSVWTGSNDQGTIYTDGGTAGLGNGSNIALGTAGATNSSWIDANASSPPGNEAATGYRIYAISSVVPEPSTFILWSVLAAGFGFGVVRRRRKQTA